MNSFSKIRSLRLSVLSSALAVACACQGQPSNAATSPQPLSPSGEGIEEGGGGGRGRASQPLAPNGGELSWPRQFEDNGIKVAIFQPQIEKWEGSDFETRSAVAVTQGSNAPIYGVFWMKARADVDKAARIVTLNDIVVTRANFPSATDLQSAYLALIRKHVPLASKTIALDHLEAGYAISEAVKKARAVPVKNDPPMIIYSTMPALLVLVDGLPVFRSVPDLNLERVINTRALILKLGDHVYLYASSHWYQSDSVDGIWDVASNPPASLEAARQVETVTQNVDLMPTGTNSVRITPTIYVSTIPAELIQTEGDPSLVPIEGTTLMQVQNSDNALFLSESDQHYYVLLSGRWFKSTSTVGPWEFVPYKELPGDFAKIPPTHPKANVLVSIPGTPQANEAVIANSIPQTATVQRHEASLDVTYDGAPEFKPIAGTPLQYAVNTPTLQRRERRLVRRLAAQWAVASRNECAAGHLQHSRQLTAPLRDLRAGLWVHARRCVRRLYPGLSWHGGLSRQRRGLRHGLVLPALYRKRLGRRPMHLWIRRGLRRQLGRGLWVRIQRRTLARNLGSALVGPVRLGKAPPL